MANNLTHNKFSDRIERRRPPGRAARGAALPMDREDLRDKEGVASLLFQPDILASVQYDETGRSRSRLSPERRLMLAVLKDTIDCFQQYLTASNAEGRALFRDAEEWILEEDSDWLFSFENICEVLGLNPQYIREGLACWKKKTLGRRPRARICRLNPRGKSKGRMEDQAETIQPLKAASG